MKVNKLLKASILTSFITLNIINLAKSDSVCTENLWFEEIIQDIKDNGKLDCKRVPLPAPTDKLESEEDRKTRLEGAWDTDCSFEADYDWMKQVKKNYGMLSSFVDSEGKSQDK